MKERLLEFLTAEGLSAAKFAEKMDVGAANISHVLSGRNNPGYDFISKMLIRFPNLSPDWLLMGEGEIYRNSPTIISTPPSHNDNDLFTAELPKQSAPKKMKAPDVNSNCPQTEKVIILYDNKTFETFTPGFTESK